VTRLLLVEDSPSDRELTLETLREAGLAARLHTVEDGDAALRFLRREPPFEDAFRPTLVLLDLDLPKRDGREVLREIKRDAALNDIAVVVLTASDARDDVANSWEHDADGYIVKPLTADQLRVALRIIEKRGIRGVRGQ
jgi:two-component system, chemotaxis family, response regulator Rcp1